MGMRVNGDRKRLCGQYAMARCQTEMSEIKWVVRGLCGGVLGREASGSGRSFARETVTVLYELGKVGRRT